MNRVETISCLKIMKKISTTISVVLCSNEMHSPHCTHRTSCCSFLLAFFFVCVSSFACGPEWGRRTASDLLYFSTVPLPNTSIRTQTYTQPVVMQGRKAFVQYATETSHWSKPCMRCGLQLSRGTIIMETTRPTTDASLQITHIHLACAQSCDMWWMLRSCRALGRRHIWLDASWMDTLSSLDQVYVRSLLEGLLQSTPDDWYRQGQTMFSKKSICHVMGVSMDTSFKECVSHLPAQQDSELSWESAQGKLVSKYNKRARCVSEVSISGHDNSHMTDTKGPMVATHHDLSCKRRFHSIGQYVTT